MKISDLKQLEDKEFIKYISDIQRKKTPICIRCGTFTNDRRTISVTKDSIKIKKLCTLCESCYSDLLDFIGVADVDLD